MNRIKILVYFSRSKVLVTFVMYIEEKKLFSSFLTISCAAIFSTVYLCFFVFGALRCFSCKLTIYVLVYCSNTIDNRTAVYEMAKLCVLFCYTHLFQL